MPYIQRTVKGCAYRYPAADETHKKDVRELSVAELRAMCPKLRKLPIMLDHYDAGTLYDIKTNTHMPSDSPFSGSSRIGVVTHSWIDPKTHALHWAGSIRYDTNSDVLCSMLHSADHTYRACSMKYKIANPPHEKDVVPYEISLVTNPLWPGTRMSWLEPLSDYMRNTGYLQYTTMESPAATPASTTVAPMEGQARDANGRFISTNAQALPPLTDSEAENSVLIDAIGKADPLVQDTLKQLLKERDELAARAQKNEVIAEQAIKEKSRSRQEVLRAITSFISQHALSDDLTQKIADMQQPLLVAASNATDTDVDALWSLLHETARTISVPPPTQYQQPQAMQSSRAVRPGDVIPSNAPKRQATGLAQSIIYRTQPQAPPPVQQTRLVMASAQQGNPNALDPAVRAAISAIGGYNGCDPSTVSYATLQRMSVPGVKDDICTKTFGADAS